MSFYTDIAAFGNTIVAPILTLLVEVGRNIPELTSRAAIPNFGLLKRSR
jgi:hypothetical protein